MGKITVADIYHEFENDIEKELIQITSEPLVMSNSFMKSACFVGSLQKISRKIYRKYGVELFDPNASPKYVQDVIYQQLYNLSTNIRRKYGFI
jgi:hypothetical protein